MIKPYLKIPVFITCFLAVFNCFAGIRMRQTGPEDKKIYQTIDSLNNLAFQIKRYNIPKALDKLYKSSSLAELHKYEKGMANALLTEAGIYQQNGYYKRALSLYYKALNISNGMRDTLNIAKANQQIANTLVESGKYHEAESLYNVAFEYYALLNKIEDIINMKNSLGHISMEQGKIERAMSFFNEALLESSKIHYEYGIKKASHNIGLLYIRKGNLANAKVYFNRAIAFDKKSKDRYGIALNQNQLALIAMSEKDYKEGIRLLESSIESSKLIDADQLHIEAIKNLILIYKKINDPGKVAEWQEVLITHMERLSEKERLYSMNFVEILKEKEQERFSFQKNAFDAQQKTTKANITLGVVSLVLLTLIILTIMWYKNYRRTKDFSKELMSKNDLIQKSIIALNNLNKEISEKNQRLEESNLMKDKLLSIISHDLRTPLSNTKGILNLVEGEYLNPLEISQLLKELDTQYIRAITLLDNLLFWIKGQMAGNGIDKKVIDLRQLIDKLFHELEISAKKKGIFLINDVDPNITIMGDQEMIKVIFRNLLSNAIKFTEKGHVRVYALSQAKEVSIRVKDSGVGMTGDVMKKVLEKNYFTTKGTHKESGTGFGLQICKDLILKHSGRLEVKSETGKGSVFFIIFPND